MSPILQEVFLLLSHQESFKRITQILKCPLEAQMVKNLPAMQETRVQSLSREYPQEEEMATTPVFLPGKSYG